MLTTAEISELQALVKDWHNQGKTVAFVPTMGNLHSGHIKLMQEAKKRAHHVVVSIFVNPMQFGENEDLNSYPRTLDADQAQLISAEVDCLFTPTPSLIYPKGLDQQTYIEVPNISSALCGESRPGHFKGVATIVCKLFNIVQPDLAIFGKKDFQQLLIIKTMVSDLSMPIKIIGIDTVREDSGLAMSSRNGYLSVEQKAIAPRLKRTLNELIESIQSGKTVDDAIAQGKLTLAQASFVVDYLEVRSALSLARPNHDDKSLIVLAAAKLGSTRLIDNLEFQR